MSDTILDDNWETVSDAEKIQLLLDANLRLARKLKEAARAPHLAEEDCPFSRQDLITAIEGIFARCYQDGGQYLQSHGWYNALDNLDVVLAEFVVHPTDDDEPVTAEWLNKLFKRLVDPEKHVNKWQLGELDNGHPFTVFRQQFFGEPEFFRVCAGENKTHLRMIHNRGDVRRLCAALGIELKDKS